MCPILEGGKFDGLSYGEENGLVAEDPALGPMSFDKACFFGKKNKKRKKKKKRLVDNLGIRVISKPNFLACLSIRQSSFMRKIDRVNSKVVEDSFTGGDIMCCESMTESDVGLCNDRLRRNEDSEVGSNVRDSILNLGVVCKGGNNKLLKDLEEMERRYKEGLVSRKAHRNQVP